VSTPPMPSSPTPKPVTDIWQPKQTRLPDLTLGRRFFRRIFQYFCRVVVFICTRTLVNGRENYPHHGPALIAINHLGDPDAVLVVAALPDFPEMIGKIELRDITVLRWLGDLLGVIWVHRGRPDRRAISAALQAFRLGRCVLIAPEGRESVSGALELGTEGAAFLALEAGVPVVPVTIIGSEFRRIENGIKKLHRSPVTVTIGTPIQLPVQRNERDSLQKGTRFIMETLARQLPPEFRGEYNYIEK
jgi:1-acyl-sn-glycerol-3-phosphate acyltransferase